MGNEGGGNTNTHSVKVVVRVRPHNESSSGGGCVQRRVVETTVDGARNEVRVMHQHGGAAATAAESFSFDEVAQETTTQAEVFNMVGRDVVDSLLEGYSCCIFAYGQTGAGKTFTMQGTESDDGRGVIPRVLEYLFTKIDESQRVDTATNPSENEEDNENSDDAMHDAKEEEEEEEDNDADVAMEDKEEEEASETKEYSISCSYVEIYNETVSDLLGADAVHGSRKLLTIREDGKHGVFVDGVTKERVDNAEQTYKVYMDGSRNRTVASTAMNRESSRSHSVFTVTVESKTTHSNTSVVSKRHSTLHLVDLAGSERQKHSEASGQTLKEATAINKSLSSLGNVIKALVDIQSGRDVTRCHIPYRDSKLTFLLKDALGGNSKCAMIANISPSIKCADETISTLMFAQRVKLVTNKAVRNEEAIGSVLAMQEMIRTLNLKIESLTAANGDGGVNNEEMSTRIAELETLLKDALFRATYAEDSVAAQLTAAHAKIKSAQEFSAKLERALQAQKMIVRLRDGTIQRIQDQRGSGSDGDKSAAMADSNAEELEILRQQVDCHPEVVRYRMDIESLKSEIEGLKRQLTEKDAESFNASVSRQLSEVLQFKQDLSRQLDVARRGVIRMEELKDAAERRATNVAAAFKEQATLQDELMGHLSATSAERDALTAQLKDTEAAVASFMSKLAVALAARNEYADELEATTMRADAMKSHFESQLQDAAAKYSSLDGVRIGLKNDIAALKVELAQLGNRFAIASKQKSELEAVLEGLRQDVAAMQRDHAAHVETMESEFATREATMRADAQAIEARLVQEKNNVAAEAASKIGVLKQEYNTLTKKLDDELRRIHEEHAVAMTDLESKLSSEAKSREEALLKDAEATRMQHTDAMDATQRKHEAALMELTNTHRAAFDAHEQDATAKLVTLREELESKASAMEAAWASEREDMHASHAKDVVELKDAHDSKMSMLKSSMEEQMRALAETHEQSTAALERTHYDAMIRMSEEHSADQAKLEESHAASMQNLAREHEDCVAQKDAEHASAVEKLTAAHSEAIAALQKDHSALTEQRDALQWTLSQTEIRVKAVESEAAKERIASKESMKSLHMQMTIASDDYKAQLAELHAKLEAARTSGAALQAAVDSHEQQMRTSEERYRMQMDELRAAHETDVASLVTSHRAVLTEKDARLCEAKAEAAANLTIAPVVVAADVQTDTDALYRSQLDTEMAELRQDRARLEILCESHDRTIDDLQRKLEEAEARAKEDTRAAVDAAVQALVSEKDTHQRSFDAAIRDRDAAIDIARKTDAKLADAEASRASLQTELARLQAAMHSSRDQMRYSSNDGVGPSLPGHSRRTAAKIPTSTPTVEYKLVKNDGKRRINCYCERHWMVALCVCVICKESFSFFSSNHMFTYVCACTNNTAIGNCLFEAMAAIFSGFIDCSGHVELRRTLAMAIFDRYATDIDYRTEVQMSFVNTVTDICRQFGLLVKFYNDVGEETDGFLGSRCRIQLPTGRTIDLNVGQWLDAMRTPVSDRDDWFKKSLKWGTDIHLEAAARVFGVTIVVINVRSDKHTVRSVLKVHPPGVKEDTKEKWCLVFDGIGHYEAYTSDPDVHMDDTLVYTVLDLSTAAVNRR